MNFGTSFWYVEYSGYLLLLIFSVMIELPRNRSTSNTGPGRVKLIKLPEAATPKR